MLSKAIYSGFTNSYLEVYVSGMFSEWNGVVVEGEEGGMGLVWSTDLEVPYHKEDAHKKAT